LTALVAAHLGLGAEVETLLISTVVVAVAEIGDKTQLLAMFWPQGSNSRFQ